MRPYLYILKSLTNNRFYIGSTADLIRRLKDHDLGKSRFTSRSGPYKLVFSQEMATLNQARKAERWIKRQKSRIIIEKIVSSNKLTKTF